MDGEHLAGVDGQPRLQRHAAEGNVLDRRRAIDPRAFDARRNADDVTRRAGLAAPALIGDTKRAHRKGGKQQHAEAAALDPARSAEHTSELQSLMRLSYAVFCLKKKNNNSR